jgi:hypothetical protein
MLTTVAPAPRAIRPKPKVPAMERLSCRATDEGDCCHLEQVDLNHPLTGEERRYPSHAALTPLRLIDGPDARRGTLLSSPPAPIRRQR